jgi:hypothetical protein
MIYGGTNWAGTAHPGVYTSYDYVRPQWLLTTCSF